MTSVFFLLIAIFLVLIFGLKSEVWIKNQAIAKIVEPTLILLGSSILLLTNGNSTSFFIIMIPLYHLFITQGVRTSDKLDITNILHLSFFLLASLFTLSPYILISYCGLCWSISHFFNGRIDKIGLLILLVLGSYFQTDVLLIWTSYSSFLLVPLSILIVFENNKNEVERVLLLVLFLIIRMNSSQVFSDLDSYLGAFILLSIYLKDSYGQSKYLLMSLGIYLSVLTNLNPLVIVPLSFIIKELSFFKVQLLSEIKRVKVGESNLSIGHYQIISFVVLLLVFSGVHLTPISIIYSLTDKSTLAIVILLLIEFPLSCIDSLSGNEKASVQNELPTEILVRASLLILATLPMGFLGEVAAFPYQLIASVMTLILFILIKRNLGLEYGIKRFLQLFKLSYQLRATKMDASKLEVSSSGSSKLDKAYVLAEIRGLSPSLIYATYLIFVVSIISMVVL